MITKAHWGRTGVLDKDKEKKVEEVEHKKMEVFVEQGRLWR